MLESKQTERDTQNRVVSFFRHTLGYAYLGNLAKGKNNKNIQPDLLRRWLKKRGVSKTLAARVMRQLDSAAALGEGKKLYDANKDVYRLLRYGVKDKAGAGEQHQTVWLIDWQTPEANDFAIAEEVSIAGENSKRPDLVLYVNGIALGIIELKRSSVNVSEGIRQNLGNQQKGFIRNFFSTMQLVMAGNDSQGLRYGTIETSEKYYLQWQEDCANPYAHLPSTITGSQPAGTSIAACSIRSLGKLDFHLSRICNKTRFLQLIHDFMVFDAGVKKTARHNQYFGVEAAKPYIEGRQGGIIWHTQGSGKSLTMVWLAKWIRRLAKNKSPIWLVYTAVFCVMPGITYNEYAHPGKP